MTGQHTGSSCLYCPRRALTEWSDLSAGDLELIDRHKRDRVLSAGVVIYDQGEDCDGIFCIKEGLVGERRVDSEGQSTLVRLSHPGTTVGYQEFLSRTTYRNTAETLQDSHICFIGRPILRQLLEKNAMLGERFLRKCLTEAKEMEEALVEARFYSAKARLLHTLMTFYERSGHFEPAHGHVFEIPMTRQDLAAFIGITPETVSRMIQKLEHENIAQFHGNKVQIPDLDTAFGEISM